MSDQFGCLHINHKVDSLNMKENSLSKIFLKIRNI